jgi:hypothetical protein
MEAKMPASSAALARVKPEGRSRISNGSAVLPGVDGRSTWVRRLRDLIGLHLSDLGGDDAVSEAERSIVRRAATLTVELERLEAVFAVAGEAQPDQLDLYQRTANSLRRLLERVGIERRPRDVSGVSYSAFVDPSGGSADSMTLAIGHRQDDVAVLDAVRERRPPFSPEHVVAEFASLLKSYRIDKVQGDRYAGEWPRERFSEHGVRYEPAAQPKSDLYRDLLPAINSRRVDLLDDARLVAQVVGLERRTARGGRDSIDHPPGSHDDLANAVAGVVAMLAAKASSYDSSLAWVGDPPPRQHALCPVAF